MPRGTVLGQRGAEAATTNTSASAAVCSWSSTIGTF